MPLSGGTSGAHDDAMHQGNAKRDVAGGLAGVDVAGDVLVPGDRILLTRNILDCVYLKERLSDEDMIQVKRDGADDFKVYVFKSGVAKELQHAGLVDVANGIAGLDAGGHVLAPGYRFVAARGAAEQITIRERTSDERAFRWIRNGVNDYEARVNVGGVEKVVQHEGMKGVASGIAGLDANILLSPALLPPCMEEYSNHLGAVDNFTQTGVAGTGSVNSDAANHEMDLDGGGGVGHARFEAKAAWVLGSDPTMINILIQNIVCGAGGAKTSFVGCKADFTDTSVMNSMGFRQIDNGIWQAVSGNAAAEETNAITALANGDLVSILATSAAIRFFVNGTLVETHTTRIPAVGVKLGGAVDHTWGAPSPHRLLSIDMMSGRRYL